MNKTEQIIKWISGDSIHDNSADYCVPDLTCCCKDATKASKEVKKRYLQAFAEDDYYTMSVINYYFVYIYNFPKLPVSYLFSTAIN